jgi:hypothetical protein
MTHGETFNYLYGNRVAIGAAIVTLTTAGVKTAPPPGIPFDLYTWLYDFFHQVFNITNTRLNPAPTITPPETSPSTTLPK